MEQATRNKLRNVITQCRRLLEESIAEQLEGRFGIREGKKDAVQVEEEGRMSHLSDEDQQYRRDLLDHLAHIQARGFKPKDALEQLVREVAFTHLNRFCAYKMMEAREVYVGGQKFREAVSRGIKSNGFLHYLGADGHEADERLFNTGQQELAYRHFLDWLGGLLSEEIGVLFNPNDPANRLYPRQKTLDELLGLLNDEELADIWELDETIGWVYQYFTPKELRDKARKESQAPRNSYELAFRNQFFTPRYVVEFLTDNTLGRIWYEMRKGNTALREQCRYLVRPPDEVFLAPSTCAEHEHYEENCGAAARLLLEGGEDSFPPFHADNFEAAQRMIDLAHCVSAYSQLGDGCWDWYEQTRPRIQEPRADLAAVTTGDLLNYLFLTCRSDRHGGDGAVYQEPWFIAAANDVRRRVLVGRAEVASQEQLLQAPVFIPHRPKKDPRDLKILDPACGSGHFLLYCFDLLLTIYEEAWSDPDLGPALQEQYPTLEELRRDVPRLILARNLHGIDIDLRATQIAALALWLRSQRAWQAQGLKKDRPVITRSNLVCAEPMPGERDFLQDFLDNLNTLQVLQICREVLPIQNDLSPDMLEEIVNELKGWVQCVWKDMRLASDAGSLLQMLGVEPHLQQVVQDRLEWWFQSLFKTEVAAVLGHSSMEARAHAITVVIRLIATYIRYYAEYNSRPSLLHTLFCQDTIRAMAFIEICRKRYDVVLMNPPFGAGTRISKLYLDKKYDRSKNDIYAAFVERGITLLQSTGCLGALTSRTGMFQPSLQKWRESLLLSESHVTVLADLGYGVLDSATVETAAYCLQTTSQEKLSTFLRLMDDIDKPESLLASISHVNSGLPLPSVYRVDTSSFQRLPGSPFVYWAPEVVFSLFQRCEPFESEIRNVRCGMGTLDDFRFLRLWWEVPPKTIGHSREETRKGSRWIPFAKGGTASSFYAPIHLVVDYLDDGAQVKGYVRERVGSESRKVQAQSYYFRPGIMFGRRIRRFSPACFPAGCIFSDSSNAVFVNQDSHEQLLRYTGYLNGSLIRTLLSLFAPVRKMEVGYLQRLPFGEHLESRTIPTDINDLVASCVCEAMKGFLGDETGHLFRAPSYLQFDGDELRSLSIKCQKANTVSNQKLLESQKQLNELTFDFYGICEDGRSVFESLDGIASCSDGSPEDEVEEDELVEQDSSESHEVAYCVSYAIGCVMGRWNMEGANAVVSLWEPPDPFAPLPICSPGMLQDADGLPATKTPENYPLRIDWDGILVDDTEHPDDVVRRVRDALEVIWPERAEAIEEEACGILGVKTLRDYFRKPGKGGFWDDHVKRYSKSRRKAPIYWLLQSSKKNYALWLYYHRLDKDLLFKALLNYVEPKIQREENRLGELRTLKAAAGGTGKEARKLDKDIEKQEDLLTELRDFEEKLRRAANLNLVPDLNDGVILNIAPLHELVPWKEARKYWDELLAGQYEWSTVAQQLREKGMVK